MTFLTKEAAEHLMNKYGRQRQPFLFVIDFEMQQPFVLRPDEINTKELLFDLNGFTNLPKNQPYLSEEKELTFKKSPISFGNFQQKFNYVRQQILAGNSFLTNLTAKTRLETNFSLKEIFLQSRAKYKIHFTTTPINPSPTIEVVCFSPETFIQIQGGEIASFPMKGTIDATVTNAKEQILADKKELAEHATIVDLIRNDISMVAEKVWVERFRYVEAVQTHDKTLLQVSSEVRGRLPKNFQEALGSLIFKLLPAGSISGAPKPKTLDIIHSAEAEPRGYYTGIVGYFDGQNLDSGVMIRFIEQNAEGLFFRSGGGITFMSTAEKEYQELIDKVYVPIVRNDSLPKRKVRKFSLS